MPSWRHQILPHIFPRFNISTHTNIYNLMSCCIYPKNTSIIPRVGLVPAPRGDAVSGRSPRCHHAVTTLSPRCHHAVTTLSPLLPIHIQLDC